MDRSRLEMAGGNYSKYQCMKCGKMISGAGFAQWQHYQMHKRQEEKRKQEEQKQKAGGKNHAEI